MKRQQLHQLENLTKLLLNAYTARQEEIEGLAEQVRISKELLEQSQEQLVKSRKLIDDLKLQLDQAYNNKSQEKGQSEDLQKIQAQVQKLISEVDVCIKSLE